MSDADLVDAYADADYDTYAEAAEAAADAARKENQALTANICREILTDFIKSKIEG
jgi:methionine synthase II (cobalamin-independent)